MTETMAGVGNASSVHGHGRGARAVVEKAREQVAGLIGSRPQEVIFTSGGTEANNQVLRAHTQAGQPVLVSAIEHDSVTAARAGTLCRDRRRAAGHGSPSSG